MADEQGGGPATSRAAGFWDVFKKPILGVPTYIWFGVGVIALALFLKHKKATSPATSATGLPVGANATDINSASQLANSFFAAGVMPYQGGDVFVNGTSTPATPDKPAYNTATQVVDVTRGETVGQLVSDMQKYNPGFSWADFWALNPDVVSRGGLSWNTNGDWTFTAEATPVLISRPGLVANPYTTRTGGSINGVTTNTPNGPQSDFWTKLTTPYTLS